MNGVSFSFCLQSFLTFFLGKLTEHDADYRASKKDWDTFVDSLTQKITEKDSTIPELPAKDLVCIALIMGIFIQLHAWYGR